MKRTGLVITLVGLAVGLVPSAYYTGVNLEIFDPDETAYKAMSVIDLVTGVVVVIGVIVLLSGCRATVPAVPPAPYGPPPGQPYPPQQYGPPPGGQQPYQQQPYQQQPPDLTK